MANQFTDFWRIVKADPAKSRYSVANTEVAKLYSNTSWYSKVMKGSAARFSKYSQYRNMDNDVFVARALDTIAEEMTAINAKTDLPFEIVYQNETNSEVPESVTMTVRAALRHWTELQDLNTILFDIARNTIKFGDCFFQKTSDFKRWIFIDPSDLIGISLNENARPLYYHVRTGAKSKNGSFGDTTMIPADGMIHFSLTSSMGESGPFGESVLHPTVKAFRHLSLLEDSVIIYRIVRAPERRVFFIDVGNMPPQRVKAYLESVKTEMRQKRIPNETGGTDRVDSVYNPMSMTEDFFFAQTSEGRGSKVETLPGGTLDDLNDLTYFQNKFLQGLRIPSAYMRGGSEGGSTISDGKVGVAYIEELRFANYVARLQAKLNDTFDLHFKAYLKSAGINIDSMLFKLKLVDPQNFVDYKQAEIDDKLISNYSQIKDEETLSTRYKMRRYLGMTEDDIQENEALIKQERGIPDDGVNGLTDLRMIYDKAYTDNVNEVKLPDTYNDFSKAPDHEEEEEKPQQSSSSNDDKPADDDNVDPGRDQPAPEPDDETQPSDEPGAPSDEPGAEEPKSAGDSDDESTVN